MSVETAGIFVKGYYECVIWRISKASPWKPVPYELSALRVNIFYPNSHIWKNDSTLEKK